MISGYEEIKSDWVVHVIGPDDVLSQPDELTALREANEINKSIALMEHHPLNPRIIAVVKDRNIEAC